MFGIFKKKEKQVEALISLDSDNSTNSNYPIEVVEIHNEFNSAADKLLEEANNIINEAKTKDINKVNRLEALGFKQANQVTELKPLQQKAELSEEQIKLLSYYRITYPFNKFITEEQVKNICYKYNLVCGDVGRFRGFVPEKNLKQIENFKLKERELNTLICLEKNGKIFYLENTAIFKKGDYSHLYNNKLPYDYFTNSAFQSNILENKNRFYSNDQNNIFGLKYRGNIEFIIENNNLKICAPIKDMDMSNMTIENGYKMKEAIKHIPDPVVLQPVKGGYLIITAWGDEASDPIVVNEINN